MGYDCATMKSSTNKSTTAVPTLICQGHSFNFKVLIKNNHNSKNIAFRVIYNVQHSSLKTLKLTHHDKYKEHCMPYQCSTVRGHHSTSKLKLKKGVTPKL